MGAPSARTSLTRSMPRTDVAVSTTWPMARGSRFAAGPCSPRSRRTTAVRFLTSFRVNVTPGPRAVASPEARCAGSGPCVNLASRACRSCGTLLAASGASTALSRLLLVNR